MAKDDACAKEVLQRFLMLGPFIALTTAATFGTRLTELPSSRRSPVTPQATDQSGSRFTQFMIEMSYLRDIVDSSSSNYPALRTLRETVRLLPNGRQFKVFRRPLT
jgi:hypothetical protein